MHERAADRRRKASERLREMGSGEGEEAAKQVARDENASAAHADEQPERERDCRSLTRKRGALPRACQ